MKMTVWHSNVWHPEVHQRLGETLYFFLVRLSPLNLREISSDLLEVLHAKQLGGVRVFPIFGAYDLLIRAWLHPSVSNSFRELLELELKGSSRSINTFAVEQIDRAWYGPEQTIDRELLSSLDEDSIRAAQSGLDQPLLQKLIDNQIVLVKDQPSTEDLTFFIAISLEAANSTILVEVVLDIRNYLREHREIKNSSVYRGYGFCSILFKGQVEKYFDVAKLPVWLSERFKAFGIRSETYLVQGRAPLLENEAIGEATLLGLRGRNLFAQSIVPELYERHYSERDSIERFLLDEAFDKHLTQQNKKLVHDYLIGHLNEDPTQMAMAVFGFFISVENYMRKNYKEFLGRTSGRPLKELLQVAGIEASKKPVSLGEILRLCSLAARSTNSNGAPFSDEDWQDFIHLRNIVAHGGIDFLSDWQEPLRILLRHLPRIRELIGLVESGTGQPYVSPY